VEDPGFESGQGQGIFLFTEISTPALEPASLLFDRSFDFFNPGFKRARHEFDHSPSAKVKN